MIFILMSNVFGNITIDQTQTSFSIDNNTEESIWNTIHHTMESETFNLVLDVATGIAGILAFLTLQKYSQSPRWHLTTEIKIACRRIWKWIDRSTSHASEKKCFEIVQLLPTEFMHAMRQYRALPVMTLSRDPDFWVEMILSCVRVNHAAFAERVFSDFMTLQVWMPLENYRRIIRYCYCRKYFKYLLGFWNAKSFPRDDHDCLHTMVKASFEIDDPDAWKKVDILFKLPTFTPRDAVATLRICAQRKDYDKCINLYNLVRERTTVRDDNCLRAILPLVMENNPDFAFTLIDDAMKEKGFTLSDQLVLSTIKTFASKKKLNLAIQLQLRCNVQGGILEIIEFCETREDLLWLYDHICNIASKHLTPNLMNAVLQRMITYKDLVEEMLNLYRLFIHFNCIPDHVLIHQLLKILAEDGHLAVFEIYRYMERFQIPVNSATLYALLYACNQTSHIFKAQKIYRDFVENHKVVPSNQCKNLYNRMMTRENLKTVDEF